MAAPATVNCRACGWIAAEPEAIYARVTDASGFPALFRGFGPVPGIRRIDEDGVLRTVCLDDGNTVRERFRVMEPGRRLIYQASGFAPPLGWWCKAAEGEWRFERGAEGTEVSWDYRFRIAGWPQRWAVRAAIAPFFQLAMADCIRRLTIACGPEGLNN